MARFAQIQRGTRARRPVEISMGAGEAPLRCEVRALSAVEDAEVLEMAAAFAEKRGVKGQLDGNPIYDLGRAVHTLLHACVDQESPADAPVRYFASADEILGGLDRERIAFLYELQQAFQDECAPMPAELPPEEYLNLIFQAEGVPPGGVLPFERLRPATRRNCERFMVGLSLTSLKLSLLTGSSGPASEPSSSSSASTSER